MLVNHPTKALPDHTGLCSFSRLARDTLRIGSCSLVEASGQTSSAPYIYPPVESIFCTLPYFGGQVPLLQFIWQLCPVG